MGKNNVEMVCALAVLSFNDGAVSLMKELEQLNIGFSVPCQTYLKKKDKLRVRKSAIKASMKEKQAKRAAGRKRKGFENRKKDSEGVMYFAGPLMLTVLSQAHNSKTSNVLV